MKKWQKILITGSSGFIGSHVVEEALKRSLTPVCFDRHVGHAYPKGCEIILGDVRDAEAVNAAIQGVDYAINLAGILGTQETIDNPIPSVETNIIGALNFLNACRPTKFHQVKATQIGVGNYWMNNSYSISKSAVERYCLMYNKEHGTKVAVVRGLNAYGERQKHKPVKKVVPNFIVRALNNADIEIYGDGRQIMDMIYVKDLAKILIDACVKNHGVYDQVFEAGTGRRTSVNWVAKQIIKASGKKSKIVYLPMRPGETKGAVVLANPETLRPLGDYEFVRFERAIKWVVEWYRGNYPWKDNI